MEGMPDSLVPDVPLPNSAGSGASRGPARDLDLKLRDGQERRMFRSMA